MKNWYDDIAHHYDIDPFNLITDTRDLAFEQIEANVTPPDQVIDLGCGTGDGLKRLQGLYSDADLVGLDLSSEMLKLAQNKVDFETIHDSATNVDQHAENDSFDLVLLHYVMGFVSIDDILPIVSQLLRPGGFCSVLTTTFESYQTLYQQCHVLGEETLRQMVQTPLSVDAVLHAVRHNGFNVLTHQRFERELIFEDQDALRAFARDGGWLVQVYSQNETVFEKIFSAASYPLCEAFSSEIMLIQKK